MLIKAKLCRLSISSSIIPRFLARAHFTTKLPSQTHSGPTQLTAEYTYSERFLSFFSSCLLDLEYYPGIPPNMAGTSNKRQKREEYRKAQEENKDGQIEHP